jgi:hypothetical protein
MDSAGLAALAGGHADARAWLSDAGFVDIEQQTLPSPPFSSSLVLARKP